MLGVVSLRFCSSKGFRPTKPQLNSSISHTNTLSN